MSTLITVRVTIAVTVMMVIIAIGVLVKMTDPHLHDCCHKKEEALSLLRINFFI